jgi:hypothetical protein
MGKNAKGYGRDPWIPFWEHKDVQPSGCWVWRGGKNKNGQGVVRHGGRNQVTSRVAWELAYGSIPTGLWVLHRCDNPSCINPKHLFLGTAQDNVDDMIAKGRQVRRPRRVPTCHPERRYGGHDMCNPCYQRAYKLGLVGRKNALLQSGVDDPADGVGSGEEAVA